MFAQCRASSADRLWLTMRRNVIAALIASVSAVWSFPERGLIQAQSPRTIWDGVYTDAQARRGEDLYRQHCSRCHGADLTGLPVTPRFPGAPDRTPELVGRFFDSNYNDLPLSDLVERIRIASRRRNQGA